MTIREAFREQARHCAALGSPFMSRLMTLAADRLAPGTAAADHVLNWQGDPSATADSVPLRFAGALHALRLQDLALTDVYPPRNADDETLWRAVETALREHADFILDWLKLPPQTNEVRRAAAILPALALLHRQFNLPVELLELGTSAGLNLRADHFCLRLPGGTLGRPDSPVRLEPDWTGAMPTTALPQVLRRSGVDLSPLDPSTPDGQLRLLAYLWADQPDRIERTRSAIATAREVPAEIARADAGEWLEQALEKPCPDRLRIVFHTVAWQYFPPETRRRAETAFQTASGPLARIAMENDGGKGAAVTVTTWPEAAPRLVARADFHGRWIDWLPAA